MLDVQYYFTAQDVFSGVFYLAPEIPFNKNWSNSLGYFDNAVYGEHAPKVGNGKIVASITPGNRRILIIGTRLGNMVIFDRYQLKDNEEPVFIFNTTSAIEKGFAIKNNTISYEEMCNYVGLQGIIENIGQRLEDLYTGCKKAN